MNQGCPNCEEFLELAGHSDSIQDCTSQVFEGLITLADPASSWVARWQRLDGYVAGVYAVKVQGLVRAVAGDKLRLRADCDQLPEDVLSAVEAAGVKYIPYVQTSLYEALEC